MSIAQWNNGPSKVRVRGRRPVRETGRVDEGSVLTDDDGPTPRQFHRIRTTRQQQGISLRSAARRLGISVEQARIEEDERTDLPLTILYHWQRMLEVPIAHLLVDLDGPLSEPVLKRARLVKIMKTVGSLAERAKTAPVQRLTKMLVEQLIEIMPELKDVSPWHVVGQRRRLDEFGRVVERIVPESFFQDPGC